MSVVGSSIVRDSRSESSIRRSCENVIMRSVCTLLTMWLAGWMKTRFGVHVGGRLVVVFVLGLELELGWTG